MFTQKLFVDRTPNCDGNCLPIQETVSVCSDDKCRKRQRFTVGTMLTRSIVDIVSYCFCVIKIVVSCSLLLFSCFPNNNTNTSAFCRHGSQVAQATRSYDRLHRFSRIVLCSIHRPVLFDGIQRSFSMSALVFRRMPICCRLVSVVLERLVLGWQRCP